MDVLVNIISGLGGAVLGSVGTFYGNIRLERIKAQKDKTQRQDDLTLVLSLSLDSSVKSLDSLKTSLEDKAFFPFRWTGILKGNISDLRDLRRQLYLLENTELQEKLYTVITDIALFTDDLETIETWQNGLNSSPSKDPSGAEVDEKQRKFQEDHLKERRRLKLVELVDLKRQIAEITRDLRHES